MEKHYYKHVCIMNKLEKNRREKRNINKNANHIHKMTNANARDHFIFLESWMYPFSLKYLFCFVLVTDLL